jgi:polysaccharide biosynthesis protein PelC
MKCSRFCLAFFLPVMVLMMGCAGGRPTVFVNPEFDFSAVERVAVVPFENLSGDQGMGDYMSRIFITELLSTRTFDVVEPGEVSRFLAAKGITKTGELTIDQIKELGKTLNLQGVIFGSVGESSQSRSGSAPSHMISLDARMVSVETGTTVWSAAVNSGGPGFFARLFGVGEQSRGSAVRKTVHKAIKTLVK